MKKLIIIFISLFSLQIISAQNLPKEFDKYRRTFEPTISANPLVEEAVSNGIFIIVQSYQLEDSIGKFFGVNGKKEFGSDSSIAIKVKNGYILFDRSKCPWNYNSSFNKFKKRYTPILFPTQYTELSKQPRFDSIPYCEDMLHTIFPSELYAMPTNMFFNDGFSTGHFDGSNEGYLVWLTKPSNIDFDNNSTLNFITVPTTIVEVNNQGYIYEISNINTPDEILGVMYIVPKSTGIGRLDFILHGIGIKNEDNWALACPFADSNNVFQPFISIETNEDDKLILTPNND